MLSLIRPLISLAAGLLCLSSFATAQSVDELSREMDRRLAEIQRRHEREMETLRTGYRTEIHGLRGEIDQLRDDAANDGGDSGGDAFAATVRRLSQDQDRLGLGDFSQTTLYDSTFNPAISVVGDFVLSASDKDDSFDQFNQFHLRDVEVGFFGRVDPLVAFHVFVHFDEEDIELEEAYIFADELLPSTFALKAGRYNVDFGKQSPIHDHDLPYVDKPGVLQEYLGGALRGTGVELHHLFNIGDSTLLRWSAGIINRIDGDSHPIAGPLVVGGDGHGHDDEEEVEAFGERSIDNFAFTGRVTALLEVGSESTLQIGTSVVWAPESREFFDVHGDKKSASLITLGLPVDDDDVVGVDLEQLVWGFDLTFRWQDESSGEGLTLAGEFFLSQRDFIADEDPDSVFDETSVGFYAYGEYRASPRWAFGASVDWFERAENAKKEWFDVGAWVTWWANEFNRLRFEVRYFDDELLDDSYFVAMLQWTVILGSHGHGLDF